jgi:hypothetical protein
MEGLASNSSGILIAPTPKTSSMKSIFLTAAVVGVAIAGIIYYLKNRGTGQVINVEDGFPIDA